MQCNSTFVVIRYWMIHYWQHDFSTSRTLRFMLSTFLSQLRTHPAIVNSPRDSRIINNLRSLFKRQRKLHNHENRHGDLSVRSSLSNLDTLTTQSSGTPFPTHRSDTSYQSSSHNDACHSSSRAGSRKDSAIGIAPPQQLKPSTSTPALPFLTRRRRLSSTSYRSVNSNNAWSAKMNFSLKTIKRSVPTMYNSIRHGLQHSTTRGSIANDMDPLCQCTMMKEDQHRGSMSWIGKRPLHEQDKIKHAQSSNASLRNSVHPATSSLHVPPSTPSPLHHHHLPCSYQPFILQYRSEIIAQQFCCIEQQLLQNVTWDELVELRWRKNQQQHRNAGKRVLEDESELWRRQRQGCGVEQMISYFNMASIPVNMHPSWHYAHTMF